MSKVIHDWCAAYAIICAGTALVIVIFMRDSFPVLLVIGPAAIIAVAAALFASRADRNKWVLLTVPALLPAIYVWVDAASQLG